MEIKKSNRLMEVNYEIRGEITNAAAQMEKNGEKVIKLNIGNPGQFGFDTPNFVMDNIIQNLRLAQGYSESKGISCAREAIQEYYRKKNFQNVSAEDIFIGNGVSELIITCMQGLLNKGDEVLIPAPDYPLWTAAVNLADGTPVHYICDENADWMPDIKDIEKKISRKTRAIVLINPNNPTGAVYSREFLKNIVNLAYKNNLIIFSDETYEKLVMDDFEHISIGEMAGDVPVITLNGLSKSHYIAGFRAGWAVVSGNKNACREYIEGLNTLVSLRICSNVPVQYVIKAAFENDGIDKMIYPGGRLYEQRNTIIKAITSVSGISCVKPKAGLYAFPKMDIKRFNIKDDKKFALDLLKEKKVLIIPGSGFNWFFPDHFRIVYLAQNEILLDAATRIGEFLEEYRQ